MIRRSTQVFQATKLVEPECSVPHDPFDHNAPESSRSCTWRQLDTRNHYPCCRHQHSVTTRTADDHIRRHQRQGLHVLWKACMHTSIYIHPQKAGQKAEHTNDAEGSPCHVRCSTIACCHSSRLCFSRSGVAHLCTAPNKCDEQSGFVHYISFIVAFPTGCISKRFPGNEKNMPR